MPGIVDDLVAPKAARMIGDDLFAEQSYDAIGVNAHQHRPPSRLGVDAVLNAVVRDQACRRRPHRLLDEAGEWSKERHQSRTLFLEDLEDRPFPELGMPGPLGVGDTLIGQPGVQLVERLHPRLWPEQDVAHRADLVLDLALLPARRGRAGDGFDQIMGSASLSVLFGLVRASADKREDAKRYRLGSRTGRADS